MDKRNFIAIITSYNACFCNNLTNDSHICIVGVPMSSPCISGQPSLTVQVAQEVMTSHINSVNWTTKQLTVQIPLMALNICLFHYEWDAKNLCLNEGWLSLKMYLYMNTLLLNLIY